jgi:hypothetical protein
VATVGVRIPDLRGERPKGAGNCPTSRSSTVIREMDKTSGFGWLLERTNAASGIPQ